MKRILALFALVLTLMSGGSLSAAEDISALTDAEVRKLLIERLDDTEAKPDPAFNPAMVAWKFQRNFTKVKKAAGKIFGSYDKLPALPGRWWKKMTNKREGGGFGQFAVAFVASIVAGIVASALLRRRMRRGWQGEQAPKSRAGVLLSQLLVEGIGILVLGFVATAIFFIFAPDDSRDRTLFFFFLAATLIVSLIASGSRAIFSPDRPNCRIPAMNDRDARRFHRAILMTVGFGAFGFFSCASFAALGIHGPVHDLLLVLVGILTTILLTVTIGISRRAIAGDILAGAEEPSRIRQMAARIWPTLAMVIPPLLFIGLMISVFLGGLPLYGAGVFTIMLVILSPIGEAALARAVTALDGSAEIGWSIAARTARIALLLLVIVLLALAWRVDLTVASDGGIQSRIFSALIQIAAIVAVSYAVWQVVRVFLDQKIASEDAAYAAEHGVSADMEGETGGPGKSRTRTLLPLLRRAALIVLTMLVVLVSLSALGVETGPLLAGAGVVGLAIGFGSQTLVKDIVTGFFFLLEDAFRLGEYIDIGAAKGTVEQISVRSMKLRHHRGALNTVPFGSIDVIENYSRDWAIMKLRVRVPFETDLNMVRKLLKKVGREMMEIDAIKDDFLQPFKAQGAVDVDDYGFVISTKFMSKPGTQFTIRRYAFQAMQDAFEEHGIPFSQPSVRVFVGTEEDEEDEDGGTATDGSVPHSASAKGVPSLTDKQVVGAAASAVNKIAAKP